MNPIKSALSAKEQWEKKMQDFGRNQVRNFRPGKSTGYYKTNSIGETIDAIKASFKKK